MTCEKLHAELVKNSWHFKDLGTRINTQKYPRVNHPARTTPSCTKQALQSDSCSPAQMFPLAKNSKLPRPIKRSSGSNHTFPLDLGSHMGEGKHPTKPTCVIKALQTAALLPKFSLLKQSMAQLDHLFPKAQKPMLATTATSSSKVTSSVKPSVEHTSATQSTVLASAPLSSSLSSSVPIAKDISVGNLHSTFSQSDAQAASTPSLEQEELIMEDLSNLPNTKQEGSLVVEQPRAPPAPSLPPIPKKGAAALAQGGGPHHTGNHFKPGNDANSSVLMSRLATSHPAHSLTMDANSSSTSTCLAFEPSDVQPRVELPSSIPSQDLSSVPLSSQTSSTVHTCSQVETELSFSSETEASSSEDEDDGDEFPGFTPSHCRHLNHDLFYINAYKARWHDLHSLGSVARPPPLALEAADPAAIGAHLLEALQGAMEDEWYEYALDLHRCCIIEAQADRSQVGLLRRNCVRLHLLQQDPDKALNLCNQILSADSEDVIAIQLQAQARSMLAAPLAAPSSTTPRRD